MFLLSLSVVTHSLWYHELQLPGSSFHEIFQARKLEGIAISFSRGSSHSGVELESHVLASRLFTTETPGSSKPYLLTVVTIVCSQTLHTLWSIPSWSSCHWQTPAIPLHNPSSASWFALWFKSCPLQGLHVTALFWTFISWNLQRLPSLPLCLWPLHGHLQTSAPCARHGPPHMPPPGGRVSARLCSTHLDRS